MKIALLSADFPPFLTGVGDYTDRLAGAMRERGADVTVVTLAGEVDADDARRSFPVRRVVAGTTLGDRRALVDALAGFDLVNVQYPGVRWGRSPLVNLLPWLVRRPARTVVTVHDARVMRWRWRLRMWPMLLGVDGILHVDPDDWNYLEPWCTLGAPPHACVPIASNVEVLPVDPARRAAWRAELGLAPDDVACAFFGILYPHKGVDELLDASHTLRAAGHKLRVVVVGDFDRDAEWRAALERRLTGGPGVVWVRGASLARVSECLHACDLAALPFHSGTSTNRSSMLATIGHGLPTVTTRGPATPLNFSDEFEVLLVPPREPGELAAAIGRVLTDPAERDRLAQGAARTANRTSWDGAARAQLDFFARVLGRPITAEPSEAAACAS